MMNDDAAQLVRVPIADATPAEIDGAERLLRAALARDGSDNDALFELALVLYAKQNLEEALDLISKAIDREPSRPRAYYHRAMIRHAQGSLHEALADFDTELQRAPDDVEAILSRAVTLAHLGDRDRALTEYARVMQLAPDDPRPWFNRGMLRSESDPELAVSDFSEAIRRDAAKADAHLGRGFLLRAKGLKREALADFTTYARIGGPQLPTVERWIQQLSAELSGAPSSPAAPAGTPLSDLISAVLADPSSSHALATFHRAFLDSMVGVIAEGAPPGHAGEHRAAAGEIRLASASDPAGRVMILACADRAAFVRKFHQRFNAEMRGRDLLTMVLKLPDCEGVLVNSAASFHSVVILRAEIAGLLKSEARGAASHEAPRDADEGRTNETPKRPDSRRPWWKFW